MAWTPIFTAPPPRIWQASLALGVVLLTIRPGAARAQSDGVASKLAPASSALVSTDSPHPLDPALRLARESLQHSQAHVRDYTAILTKRCRVEGELSPQQQAFVKIRNRRMEEGHLTVPMSVYMKFLNPATIKGREVIWVEGRNKGRLVAHEAGLKNLLRVNLDPDSPLAMRGQRYPITEIGLEKLVQQMIEKGDRDRQQGECQVDMYPDARVNKRDCWMVQIIHPVTRSYFDFHRAHIFFDEELKLPVRYASWTWPTAPDSEPSLEEEYTYTNIKINVGLTDLDFDPDNPEYDFW